MFNGKNLLSVLFAAILLAGCGGGGADGGSGSGSSNLEATAINNYVDDVVIATYADLREKATALRVAVERLSSSRTQANLDAAKAAWVASRIPWEQSEAWLFGPVDSSGYDPALDTWPVNRTDLDAVLNSGDSLTEEYISGLDPELKGFHTAEYLLYAFQLDRLQERQLSYLTGTAKDIESTAIALHNSWTAGDNPYGQVMKGAGNNSVYPSQTSALEQMIEGMSTILVEVGTGKIADPYDEGDTELVESQFSFNSRADFAHDIVGVLNVWKGCRVGANGPNLQGRTCTGTGLDDVVRASDSALATRVETEINDAIDKILAISQPFRDAITDPDQSDEIEAAQAAIAKVDATLKGSGGVLELIRR